MMEYKGYVGKVELDADARLFHGEVTGIRDVVTFQGKSVRELEKAFRDSVDDYLAFCARRKENPDQPCSGRFVVRMDETLHRQAGMTARKLNKSLNAFVADAIAHEVEKYLQRPARRRAG